MRDFIHVFNVHGLPYPFIQLLGDKKNVNIPFIYVLKWEYYSPPLPNVACPQATARIELESFTQGMEAEVC